MPRQKPGHLPIAKANFERSDHQMVSSKDSTQWKKHHTKRNQNKVGKQIMADLPQDRLKEEPPFTYCGVDMFGPFEIKERRNTLIWGHFYMLGKSCYSRRDEQEYGYQLVHPCTPAFHC